jgi:hypothetical protein
MSLTGSRTEIFFVGTAPRRQPTAAIVPRRRFFLDGGKLAVMSAPDGNPRIKQRLEEGRDGDMNLGGALGVLIAAKDENSRGLAVEYHLPAPASAFAGILDEADYLCKRGYGRAAAVLAGAALEEGLKSRARAAGLEAGPRETPSPVIAKLKSPDVGVLKEFDAA